MRCANCKAWPAHPGESLCGACWARKHGRTRTEVAAREQARAADLDLRIALSVIAERTAELDTLRARCAGCTCLEGDTSLVRNRWFSLDALAVAA